MSRCKTILSFTGLALGITFNGAVLATIIPSLDIDFRDTPWSGADGQSSWIVGDITAQALPGASPLYQDSTDGLGIRGGEPDEVDSNEQLQISFAASKALTGVWITDLFGAPDGHHHSGEQGQVQLTLESSAPETFLFSGIDHPGSGLNGELFVDFGDVKLVSSALFMTYPFPGKIGNEFSVAGFTAVPEPNTIALLGIGLLGIGFAGWLRTRRL